MNNNNTILLLTDQNETYRHELAGLESRLSPEPDEATIWLADPDKAAELLRRGHKPQWLACTFAGVDKLMAADLPRNYLLTNIRGVFGPLMAQYVFAHLLGPLRQLSRYARQQSQSQWQPHKYGTLSGQTMCILGTGDIGSHIARVAKSFGMVVTGVNRSGRACADFDKVLPVGQLAEALAQADALVSVLPNTPASLHLLNADSLAHLPSHATVINVGRGQTLAIDALLSWLGDNPDARAVLDVFEQEPLPQASPLWQHAQVTVTPHVAATSFPSQVAGQFKQNLDRFDAGTSLHHQVNFQRGY